jgi:hypothetical protein
MFAVRVPLNLAESVLMQLEPPRGKIASAQLLTGPIVLSQPNPILDAMREAVRERVLQLSYLAVITNLASIPATYVAMEVSVFSYPLQHHRLRHSSCNPREDSALRYGSPPH